MPSIQLEKDPRGVRSSCGHVLFRGQEAILRFEQPAVGPCYLQVNCLRTNTSSILLGLATLNEKARARFAVPLLVQVEGQRSLISTNIWGFDQAGLKALDQEPK